MGKPWQMWNLEVYHRQSGQLLAQGSFKECAAQLKMNPSALRRAEWGNRNGKPCRKYTFKRRNVQNRYRMINCDNGEVIDEGTVQELAFRNNVGYDSIMQVIIHKKRGRVPILYDYELIKETE